jgi:hypothetical protein
MQLRVARAYALLCSWHTHPSPFTLHPSLFTLPPSPSTNIVFLLGDCYLIRYFITKE